MNNFRSSRLMRPEELNELEKWTIVTPIRPVYVQLDKIGMTLCATPQHLWCRVRNSSRFNLFVLRLWSEANIYPNCFTIIK